MLCFEQYVSESVLLSYVLALDHSILDILSIIKHFVVWMLKRHSHVYSPFSV